MAHGSFWTEEQKVYLIVLRHGTTYRWSEIAERFRNKFPISTSNGKDCESKFNKDLKHTEESFWVERFKNDAHLPESEEGREVIRWLVFWLGEIPLEFRVL